MDSILLSHWTGTAPKANFGDYASVPLIAAMGKTVSLYREYQLDISPHPFVVHAIGSVLNTALPLRITAPAKFWGSGVAAMEGPALLEGHEVLAVRGPLSIQALGLPEDFPTGDPLFTFRQFFPEVTPEPNEDRLYIPHIRSVLENNLRRQQMLTAMGATGYAETWLIDRENDFLPFVQKSINAAVVGTGSLHEFILRKSFNLPVGILLPPGFKISNETKWLDTFAWLGIEGPLESHISQTMGEVETWWQNVGQPAVIPSCEALINAFPDA